MLLHTKVAVTQDEGQAGDDEFPMQMSSPAAISIAKGVPYDKLMILWIITGAALLFMSLKAVRDFCNAD